MSGNLRDVSRRRHRDPAGKAALFSHGATPIHIVDVRESDGRMIFRDLVIDANERRVYRNDSEIQLTHTEFDLLAFLASNAGKVLSREKILNSVWGYEYPIETRVIDVHVRNLRRKIEEDASHPLYILAVPGIGYRFTATKPGG